MKLRDKVAIITGAGGGLGAATARLFAAQGAKVVLTDVDGTALKVLADELPDAVTHVHDVSQEADWLAVLEQTAKHFNKLDILVNNAGVYIVKPLQDTTLEDYNRVIATNQTGCFLGMKLCAPLMANGGSIVNVSSIDGLRGRAFSTAYCASKFAVHGMTKAAALELVGSGIRVNSVHPGGIATNMLPAGSNPEGVIPMNRWAEPIEIARAILYCASDDSSYCTGSEFVVDGGICCQ